MNVNLRRLSGAVFCAGVLAAYALAVTPPPPAGPGGPVELRYDAHCLAAEQGWVEGVVTNSTGETGVATGQAKFLFYLAGSISRPELDVFVDAIIPAGQTTRVARARIVSELRPGEACAFVLSTFHKA